MLMREEQELYLKIHGMTIGQIGLPSVGNAEHLLGRFRVDASQWWVCLGRDGARPVC